MIQPGETDTSNNGSHQQEDNPENGAHSATSWEKASLVVNAVIAEAAVAVFFYTAWDGSRQAADRAVQMKVIDESLQEARTANQISEAAYKIDQRPWLDFEGHTVQARTRPDGNWENREPAIGNETRIVFSLKNSGKTPAFNVGVALINTGLRTGPSTEPMWDLSMIEPPATAIFADDTRNAESNPLLLQEQEGTL